MEWAINCEQDKRIYEVIKDVKEDDYMGVMEVWGEFMKKNLQFPFEAVIAEDEGYGPLKVGDRVKVTGVGLIDDLHGVYVDLKKGKCKYSIELCQLETDGVNRELLEDYNMWFSNF